MSEEKAYDNTNSGALFKNDKKVRENQPDYTGSLNAAGVDYWMSAWLKKSRAGKTFMSIAITQKDDPDATSRVTVEVDDDDIPF